MYAWISVVICSLGLPLRPVKKAFTSGWVNRYDDVPADTPDITPARSAAVQFGGSAAAVAAVPKSIAPAIMPAPITLRENITSSLIDWTTGLFQGCSALGRCLQGVQGGQGGLAGLGPTIRSTPQSSPQYQASTQ